MSSHPIPPLTDDQEAEIQRQIAADPDNPEITDEQAAQGKPFAEVFPDLAASIKRERPSRQPRAFALIRRCS